VNPTKLTPELHEKFVALILECVWIHTACKACRIHRDTFYGWVEKAGKGVEPYAAFIEDVYAAEGNAEIEMLRSMREEEKHWQRDAWILEKRFPKSWSEKYIKADEAGPSREATPADASKVMRELFGSAVIATNSTSLAVKVPAASAENAKISK
jgi:hypothetical protein